jgi:hypothetical protein
MASAARKFEGQFDLHRKTLQSIALTQIERDVLAICRRAAVEQRELEPTEVIMARLGLSGYGTVPGVLKRLEAKGLISRSIYQRGRQVCIVETGQCTAPPSNTAPHWRLREENVPTPAIQQVRQKMPQASVLIEQEARRLGKHMSDFLADLVYIGWHEYDQRREEAA